MTKEQTAFAQAIKEVEEKHGMKLGAQIVVTANGIIPQVVIIPPQEKTKKETKK